jgi:hypothetical protein
MYGDVPLTKKCTKMYKNGGGGTDTHEKNFQKTAQYGRVETVFVNV